MAFIVNTKYKDILMQFFRPTHENKQINALSLFFQKQVNMKTNQTLGYEALLRWFDPTFGYVAPERCLEIVDFYNLTKDLNQWLVIQAAGALQKLPSHHYVAINVCAQALTLNFAHDVLDTLLKAKCDPRRLHIEITEHKAPRSFKELASTVAWLRRQGIKVALDDFGTGHATMNYLTYVDLDTIKIDKSYIRGIDQDKSKQSVLKNLLSLIEVSDADVLVEGVETHDEATTLQKLGVSLAQGYLYGRPVSLSEVVRLDEADMTRTGSVSMNPLKQGPANVYQLFELSKGNA